MTDEQKDNQKFAQQLKKVAAEAERSAGTEMSGETEEERQHLVDDLVRRNRFMSSETEAERLLGSSETEEQRILGSNESEDDRLAGILHRQKNHILRTVAWVMIVLVSFFGIYRVQTIANQNHADSNHRVFQNCQANNVVRADIVKLVQSSKPLSIDPTLQTKDPALYMILQQSAASSAAFVIATQKSLAPVDCYALSGVPRPQGK